MRHVRGWVFLLLVLAGLALTGCEVCTPPEAPSYDADGWAYQECYVVGPEEMLEAAVILNDACRR